MKDGDIIEGQISIFELPLQELIHVPIEDATNKEENILKEESIIKSEKIDNIIKSYSESCSRIVKTYSGALLVELKDKTLYFNSDGVKEFELQANVGIMPGEEIIVANFDKEINELQKQKLEELNPKEYIKRKGDADLIIPGEKTIVINPKGWVLEFMQEPKYHEDEIFSREVDIGDNDSTDNITGAVTGIKNTIDIKFEIDDVVVIEYQGAKSLGKVVRIYIIRVKR
jgi:hypothetical protein